MSYNAPIPNTEYQYSDDDISTLMTTIIGVHGGYHDNCRFLLANQFVYNHIPCYVCITPAVDTVGASLPVDYYLDKAHWPDDGGVGDVFDEILLYIVDENATIRILTPFNITHMHWHALEMIVIKTGNSLQITSFSHDPYGGGQFTTQNRNELMACLAKRSHDCGFYLNTSTYPVSPYARRQHADDGTSCGPIIVREIEKRLLNQQLVTPYEPGALILGIQTTNGRKATLF